MFHIKTFLKSVWERKPRIPSAHKFPTRGSSKRRIINDLQAFRRMYTTEDMTHNIGWLTTPPFPIAVWAHRLFVDANPNLVGTWTSPKSHPWGSERLEADIILKMCHLYKVNRSAVEGYITSGGTEGNLYAAWAGRDLLRKKYSVKNICLLQTSLTNHSVKKTASIVDIPHYNIPLDPTSWGMDADSLRQTIYTLYHKGVKGFLISLTRGYTLTGSSDDLLTIENTVRSLHKKYTDLHCLLSIDAALNGLIEPFLDTTFTPFSSPLVQSITVDFHKFAGVPIPAGMVLYRREMRETIQRPIDYLPVLDATVLASRPGTAAAAIWAVVNLLGKRGFIQIVRQQMENKNFFTSELRRLIPEVQVITHPQSLTCGLIFNKKITRKLNRPNQYGMFSKPTNLLFTNGSKTENIFKCYFLPHVTRMTIRSFLQFLQENAE